MDDFFSYHSKASDLFPSQTLKLFRLSDSILLGIVQVLFYALVCTELVTIEIKS